MPATIAQNVATLIAAEKLDIGIVSATQDILRDAGMEPLETAWLEPAKAVDIFFAGDAKEANTKLSMLTDAIDIAVQPTENRRKRLLISDMDSTMITIECIDELADYAGIKAQIAEVTERAMLGELDFEEALRARVNLLAGLDENMIQRCLDERVTIMPGAEILVRTMAGWGAHTILISGGFTHFARPVAEQIGFAQYFANHLEITAGQLSGQVVGQIVDAQVKREQLELSATELGLGYHQTLAIGDGANDIPMIEQAGLGVAYHAKPKAAEAADFAVRHGDLTALLYAQGVARSEWIIA
jgi:phosphoserine phosphatase